nr:hypothetical protein [Tanacetum cinerariifolium]
AVGVEEGEVALAKLLGGLIVGYAIGLEALLPEIEAAFGHGVANFSGLAGATAAGRHLLPGEERENGTRRTNLIAKVKVVGIGCVEVDGALQKAQAQHL